MLKELKYLLFLLVISIFFFFVIKYYISDNNKKDSYRSLKSIDQKIINFSQDLILLKNNTNNIVEYVEKTKDRNKKKYNFWILTNNNE